ncbi:hypothetical protein WR25_11821 [Diploscapter pachys]|uniref:Uncharacterized protein n=1 Tax=Diploscapter pachys TaxID=2018661 RepID=A0A2A2KLR1_9BILA|nr:hypothetical protein WR25_11821 [Diploscapter pachys]
MWCKLITILVSILCHVVLLLVFVFNPFGFYYSSGATTIYLHSKVEFYNASYPPCVPVLYREAILSESFEADLTKGRTILRMGCSIYEPDHGNGRDDDLQSLSAPFVITKSGFPTENEFKNSEEWRQIRSGWSNKLGRHVTGYRHIGRHYAGVIYLIIQPTPAEVAQFLLHLFVICNVFPFLYISYSCWKCRKEKL